MRLIRSLPGFGGRMGRLAYLGGIAGTCLAAVAFTAASRGIGPDAAPAGQAGPVTAWTGIAFLLCMSWLLICLNARRLRDAGLSAAWCAFPFAVGLAVPALAGALDEVARALATMAINVGFVAVLAVLPSRAAASRAADPETVTA